MPSFAGILKGREDQIIAFLSESGKDELIDPLEYNQDTSTSYLNVTAHGSFLDSLQRPVINPPWGTLNAIDLNSGDFLWKFLWEMIQNFKILTNLILVLKTTVVPLSLPVD